MNKAEGFLFYITMKLLKITLACTNLEKMTEFYSSVFNVNFSEHEFPSFKMYSGKIGDVNFLFCPNEIAGVEAKQNRHQFDYSTDNIDEVIEKGIYSGGRIHTDLQKTENESFVCLFDPDGNTINFIQKN